MRIIIYISFSLIGYASFSQGNVPTSVGTPKKYSDQHIESKNAIDYIYDASAVSEKPQFVNGEKGLKEFFDQNYIVPQEIIKNNVSDKIFASFIVERDGTLTNIKILRDLGFGTGKEAIRVFKKMPKWIPGKINGKAVRVNYFIPISINEKR
ncbi:MAG: energy transducer TonB [Bacteroidota bacterium]